MTVLLEEPEKGTWRLRDEGHVEPGAEAGVVTQPRAVDTSNCRRACNGPPSGPSEETDPADALTSDFWPPEP